MPPTIPSVLSRNRTDRLGAFGFLHGVTKCFFPSFESAFKLHREAEIPLGAFLHQGWLWVLSSSKDPQSMTVFPPSFAFPDLDTFEKQWLGNFVDHLSPVSPWINWDCRFGSRILSRWPHDFVFCISLGFYKRKSFSPGLYSFCHYSRSSIICTLDLKET